MSINIIVARYNENVKWTKQFPNVIIYNKGVELNDDYNELFLNNVGKEGHTYYTYICDNYDNLPEYTIFLQGNPFDHSPNIISNLNKYINNKELDIDFEFLSEALIVNTVSDNHRIFGKCMDIYNTWNRIFNEVVSGDKELRFGCGAQFIVSKNTILKKPREFYENIVNILGYNIDPNQGHDVERLHHNIFMG